MEYEKICAWLGLPSEPWPPDHYSLLGLKPGEGDVALIEQHVHERLAKLRGYQLSHPDQATEAMNRLAQAFMCLSDPEAKKAYDQQNGLKSSHSPAESTSPGKKGKGTVGKDTTMPASPPAEDTAVGPKTQVDWKHTPPPIRAQPAAPVPAPAAAPPSDNGSSAQSASIPDSSASATTSPVSQPAEAAYDRAKASPEARRGLITLQALVDRIDQTRKLLWAWEKVGRYLNRPRRRLSRVEEQHDLTRRLQMISDAMDGFPRILGRPGQPGYRVLAMARLEMTATMFNMLDFPQRDALARDWLAGKVVLLSHRKFLLHELKARRRVSRIRRFFWSTRAFVNDHPDRTLLLVLLAIGGAGLLFKLLW